MVSSEINDGESKWVRKLTGHNQIGKQLWLNVIRFIYFMTGLNLTKKCDSREQKNKERK